MKLDQMQEQQTDAQCGEYTIKDRAITRIGFHAITKQSESAGTHQYHRGQASWER